MGETDVLDSWAKSFELEVLEVGIPAALAVARLRQMATLEAPPAEVETEVDGLQLHLSSRSETGYR